MKGVSQGWPDTWDALGMRGTGSHDIAVEDVHVPAYRTFPMVPELETGSHYGGPLYRFPLAGIAATGIPTVMPGVARQAIDAVREKVTHCITSAKQGATRQRRLRTLIDACEKGEV